MNIPKIVSFHIYPEKMLIPLFKDKLEPLTIVRAGIRGEISEEEACEAVKDASIILAFPLSPFLSRKILDAAKHVILIQNDSVGYDNVDLEASRELGIPVANNPGWNTTSVAEHTIMLMLMTLKKTIYAHTQTVEKGWIVRTRVPELLDKTFELRDKTVGLIGLGAIGSEVARLTNAFGANIIYYKRNRLSKDAENALNVEYRSFKDLLSESDIVSIHVPLTDETRNLVGREEISLMKEGAIIVNTAREGILDEYAAADALRSEKLSGVGLDVFNTKTVNGLETIDSPLVGLNNVVFTPHQGGTTSEARKRGKLQTSDNIVMALKGERPLYLVNNVWPPQNRLE